MAYNKEKLFKLFAKGIACTISISIISAFSGCDSNSSTSDSDTTEATTEEINGEYYHLEYDSETVDEGLALALEKYFRAIEIGDYDMYCETLYPSYIDEMNALLEEQDSNLEETFNTLDDTLRSGAEEYLPTDEEGETESGIEATYEIHALEMYISDDNDTDVDEVLDNYRSAFGDDYVDEMQEDSDEMYDVYFAVKALCNGETEEYIVSNVEIIGLKQGEDYYLLG